jgi:Trypsin-like peptidase domain
MRDRRARAALAAVLVVVAVGGPAAVANAACNGARPGGIVVTQDNTLCTLNFVFHGSDHRTYIGTAGHCVPADTADGSLHGEHTWKRASGPVATDYDGNVLGHYAYAILKDPRDIAFIRLKKGVQANPAMCAWGGPTGINSDITDQTVQLRFYGNGELVGQLDPARTLTAFGMPDPDEVHTDGLISPGDSGSGVISTDGRAVGVLVTLGLHEGSAGFGLNGITRLPPQIPLAEKALGIRLRLVKAPLAG